YAHRTKTTAIYARGDAGDIRVELGSQHLDFAIKPVRCELEFRRALANASGQSLVLLVDYEADRLPADLQGRLARGRVYAVDRSRRLARLFKAQGVSAQVLASRPLCELLLEDPRPFALPLSGPTVDLRSAWRALLHRHVGIPFDGDLTAERLLFELLMRPPTSLALDKLGASAAGGLELIQYLKTVTGGIGPLIWKAWLRGTLRTVAALAFVLEVSAGKLAENAALRATLLTLFQGLDPSLKDTIRDTPGLLEDWGALAGKLYLRINTDSTRELCRTLIAEANGLIADDELAKQVLATSRYLPIAYEVAERRATAALLDAARAKPSPKVVERVDEDVKLLANHQRANTEAGRELVARMKMAVRLLAYLASRPDLEARSRDHGSNGAVYAQSTHYVSDGAFVDHARERTRGTVATDLEKAIDAVLSKVDDVRQQDDEHFARAYAGWITSGSPPSEKLVPIHKGLDVYAAQFLKGKPHRRLLVVLLDGMSWANAVELLRDCEDNHFGLLKFNDAKCTPLLAALPSLTEVSRSALFAGKPIKPSEAGTGKDPDRFSVHPGLKKIGIESAKLILRGDVETQSGHLSTNALTLVRSPERLVALVVNALDDQLSGPRQLRVPADFAHIKLLRRLLDEATEANRAVLLVADHGHVLTDRPMKSVGFSGDGARYRYIGDNEPLLPHEVALSKDHSFVKAGKTRVAMLYRDSDAYGTPTTTGEHGGISLAEVIAPAVIIASDQLRSRVETAEGVQDAELDVTPFPVPDWWQLIVAGKSPRPTPKVEAKPTSVKPQIDLPFLAPTSAVPAAAEVTSVWLTRLTASKAFGGRPAHEVAAFKNVIAPRIALLADLGGRLSLENFAKKAQVLPRNVGGVVSEMQEWINFDGYAVVEYDPVLKRVDLKLDLLESYLQEMG
ncbi:MAG TPA: BREX-2 system phosphatase PglZ, partial [Polyangiaceae bacterium]